MSFNVRVFGYSGIVQVGQPQAQQFSGGAVFLNEEPCLWSQLLVCDGSTVATSARIATVPDGTQMVCVEVPDNHEIRYEVVQPGIAARAVSSDSRRGSGSFNLAWNPGYTLSIIDAAVAVAPPVAIPVLNAMGIKPFNLLEQIPSPQSQSQPYNSALYDSDPFLSSVVLLMGFEGADGSTGAPGFTDESPAAHGTATPVSVRATISTTQKKFGASSLLTTGGATIFGAKIYFPNHADWSFGASPFTIEQWIYPNSVTGTQMVCSCWGINAPNLSWVAYLNGTALAFNVSTTGSDNIVVFSGGTVSIGSQQAICVDFDGTKYRGYIGGVMVASSTTLRTIKDQSANVLAKLAIGDNANTAGTNFPYDGYHDELRITKGVARYASDAGYTPATARFPRS